MCRFKCYACVEVRGNLTIRACSLLHHVALSDDTWGFSLNSKVLYPRSHLKDPWFGFFKFLFFTCMCMECVLCVNLYGYKWRSEVNTGVFLKLADSGWSCYSY